MFLGLLIAASAIHSVTAAKTQMTSQDVSSEVETRSHSGKRRDRRLSPFGFYAPYPNYPLMPIESNQFQIPYPSPASIYGPMAGTPLMNPMTGGMPIIDPKLMGIRMPHVGLNMPPMGLTMPSMGFPTVGNQSEDPNKKESKEDDEEIPKKKGSSEQSDMQKYFHSIMSHSPFGAMMPFYQYNPYMPYSGSLGGNPFLMNPFHSSNPVYSFLNQPLTSMILTQNEAAYMGGLYPHNFEMQQQPLERIPAEKETEVVEKNDSPVKERVEVDLSQSKAEKVQESKSEPPSESSKVTPPETKTEQTQPNKNPVKEIPENSKRALKVMKLDVIDMDFLGTEGLIENAPSEFETEQESGRISL